MVTKSLILLFVMISFFTIYTTQTQTSVPVVAAQQSRVKMQIFTTLRVVLLWIVSPFIPLVGELKHTHTHSQLTKLCLLGFSRTSKGLCLNIVCLCSGSVQFMTFANKPLTKTYTLMYTYISIFCTTCALYIKQVLSVIWK